MFTQAGLDPALIEMPRARYPFKCICEAWHLLAAATGKAHVGLEAADHYRPADFHAMGMTFLASTNLLEALVRLERYERVLNTSLDFEILHNPTSIEFWFEPLDVPEHAIRMIEDTRNAVVVSLARTGIGTEITPLEVGFTYQRPVDTTPYRDLFRCPVGFSSPRSFVSFRQSDCQLPFTARNLDLARESDQILDRLLSATEDQDIVSKVKRFIVTSLPSGTPTEADVAQAVHTSQRTLHRRLTEHDTSFRKLLSEVRLELASGYLLETTIPVTEISYLIGFSDVSALSRAFKQWTGQSPATFRNVGQPGH